MLSSTVINTTASPLRLSFVGISGVTLLPGEELTLPGSVFDWVRNGAIGAWSDVRYKQLVDYVNDGKLAVLDNPSIVLRDLAVPEVSIELGADNGRLVDIRGGGLILPPPTLEFLQGAVNATDAAELTFAAQSLGEPAADRLIVVCVHGRSASNISPTAVTVGGVAATELVKISNGATAQSCSGIYAAVVPESASGSIVVTFSATSIRSAIQVYRLTGYSATPADTSGVNGLSTQSMDVPANGVVISCSNATTASLTPTWTGVTQDVVESVETATVSSASQQLVSANAALTVDVSWSGGGAYNRSTIVMGPA